jgi:hypothetical protein
MCAVKMDVISPAELGKAVAVALEAFGHFGIRRNFTSVDFRGKVTTKGSRCQSRLLS